MNKNKAYNHIIWDWNGTLLDDVWLCVEIINSLLKLRHKPTITLEQYQQAFDFPVEDYYHRIGFDFVCESFKSVGTEFILQYNKRKFECSLHSGVVPMLRDIADSGVTQSILSASQLSSLETIVEFFKLRHFFINLVGLDNHYAGGKLESGKTLIKNLMLTGTRILLIGDTVHDFQVARAIGADCVLFSGGHHPRNKLDTCGTPVVDSIVEIGMLLSTGT